MAATGGSWLATLKIKIKILFWVYIIALVVCALSAFVVYFFTSKMSDVPSILSKDTMTTKGVYALKKSYFTELEDVLLSNIKSTLNDMRENIVKNEIFRVTAVLVAVIATAMMGFTMLIGDQKITLREFMSDIIIIFGGTSFLLSNNAYQYIDIIYNFLQSIADFTSNMLLGTTSEFMKISYADGSKITPYSPIDAASSIFLDSEIAYRVKWKLTAMLMSPAIFWIPFVCFVLGYYLIPCIITVFIAIVFAKTTIFFALQFLPFFILFSSINDVTIKISKKTKGYRFTSKLLYQGLFQPMIYLALMSFTAGLFFYIFIIPFINDMFGFATEYREPWSLKCEDYEWFIPIYGAAKCITMTLIDAALIVKVVLPVDLDYMSFLGGPVILVIGISAFKRLFSQVQTAVSSLVDIGGGSAAQGIFTGNGGIFEDKNPVGNPAKELIDIGIKHGIGYDVSGKEESDMAKGLLSNPFNLLDKLYKPDEKKNGPKSDGKKGEPKK